MPSKTESESEFITRFSSDAIALKEQPDELKRQELAHSIFNGSHSKKESFSKVFGLELKAYKDNHEVGGFIATTHLDSGFDMPGVGYVRDKITVETLLKWAEELNQGIPRANKVTVNHDRTDKIVAGVAKKGSASVINLPDGEFGLYVDTIVDSTHPDFKVIDNRINIGTLDSFSIEYTADNYTIEPSGDYFIRTLLPESTIYGYTLASRPMNDNCVMIKEILPVKKELVDIDLKEEKTMTEVEQKSISAEDMLLLKEAKEAKEMQKQKDVLMKVLEDKEFRAKILGSEQKEKVMANKEEPVVAQPSIELKERQDLAKRYSSIISSKEMSLREKFRQVGLIAEKMKMVTSDGGVLSYKSTGRENKNFSTNGKTIEVKGLGITSNQNTDTDYLLSAAELQDVFMPVIFDVLNQDTTVFGMLNKDDMSNKGNNLCQFILRDAVNPTAGFYTGNSVTTDSVGMTKYQTKFKKAQVGVQVDGDMIAAARGSPIGDVFGVHIMYSTEDLLKVIDTALFGIKGAETDAEIIGMEYITNSASYISLYNVTRSNTNKLSPDAAGDTFINASSARITPGLLAQAIEQATKEGANIANLVFVCHPTQERLYKEVYRSMQRFVPTSARFGFVGRAECDGVPIFTDKNINTDDFFLVDLETHRIGVWVAPTMEMLGKRSDSDEGFIKTYFAVYNTNPRRMVQIYGCATS